MEIAACRLSDLEEKKPYVVELDGFVVGLIQVNNEIHAYENRCPHLEGPVCLGEVKGRPMLKLDEMKRVCGEYESEDEINLVCPWHGIEFDVFTGRNMVDEKLTLRKFDVFTRDGQVYVELK